MIKAQTSGCRDPPLQGRLELLCVVRSSTAVNSPGGLYG